MLVVRDTRLKTTLNSDNSRQVNSSPSSHLTSQANTHAITCHSVDVRATTFAPVVVSCCPSTSRVFFYESTRMFSTSSHSRLVKIISPCPLTSAHSSQGICRGSSFGNEVTSWIRRNRGVVIGVGSAIVVLLLLSVSGCVYRAVKRRRHRRFVRDNPGFMPVPTRVPPPGWSGRRGMSQPGAASGWASTEPLNPQPLVPSRSMRYA